ncbi:MAG: hypothetical protein ACFFAE_00375 [Candidatus Hodarchaeota archaeon]
MSTRRQRQGIGILILFTVVSCGSIIQSISYSSGGAANVLQVHLGVNPRTVYHGEQVTMSITILNVHGFENVLNVTIKVKIPEELELLSSSAPKIDLENVTDELNHNFGNLLIDEVISLELIYNVTSTETTSLTLESVNTTYQLKNGIKGFVLSNTEDIRLSGKKITTTSESLLPIPIGEINEVNLGIIKIPATPFFSVLGYLFPLLFFSISIIVLRRIRYIKV